MNYKMNTLSLVALSIICSSGNVQANNIDNKIEQPKLNHVHVGVKDLPKAIDWISKLLLIMAANL